MYRLIEMLQDYGELYPKERTILSSFFSILESWPACLFRTHYPGHLTASAWVVDEGRSHVLLLHHRKLDRWLQPGGHADGEADLLSVATRELEEETGVTGAEPVKGIFDIDVHEIPGMDGMEQHQHYDIRFMMRLPRTSALQGNHESNDIRWQPLSTAATLTDEISIQRMVSKTFRD